MPARGLNRSPLAALTRRRIYDGSLRIFCEATLGCLQPWPSLTLKSGLSLISGPDAGPASSPTAHYECSLGPLARLTCTQLLAGTHFQ